MSWLTRQSSSYHTLDPYQGLSHPLKLLYLAINKANNLCSQPSNRSLFQVQPFTHRKPEPLFSFLNPQDSPSRKLCNLFWMSLPWAEIQTRLNEQIHAFDIGCGAGNYGPFLETHSENRLASYTGVDVEANPLWEKLHTERPDFYQFHRFQGKDIRPFFSEKTNFIISQSALEHIPEDITFFEQLQEFIERRKQPTIQVHLFPAADTYSLYPFHGIRQYTPRTIAKLIKSFDRTHSQFAVYTLGAEASIQVHRDYIFQGFLRSTKDIRKEQAEAYKTAGERALRDDLKTQDIRHPSFYALVIQSYTTKPLPSVSG